MINHVPTDTHLRAKSMDVSNDRIVAAFQEVDSDILQVWVATDARGAWTLLHQEPGVKVREVCAFFRKDSRIMVAAVLTTTSEWVWDGDDSTTMLVLTECSGGGFDRSFRHEGVGRKTIAQRKHGVAVLAYHPTTSYDTARLTIEIRNEDLMLIGSFEAVITSRYEHSYRRVDSLICDRGKYRHSMDSTAVSTIGVNMCPAGATHDQRLGSITKAMFCFGGETHR
ncbi:MAG: hypothetical protein IPM83_14945 [Ignavibacteria bacterium]|nr:hypothetical protein [Ignavibacteria bacterium]